MKSRHKRISREFPKVVLPAVELDASAQAAAGPRPEAAIVEGLREDAPGPAPIPLPDPLPAAQSAARQSVASGASSGPWLWLWLWPAEPGIYAPVLVALAFMLPRIVHAHFGLLDDAVTLTNSRWVLSHPSAILHASQGAGRFLPVYWLYWAFCFAIGRFHPAVYFAGNALLEAVSISLLIALMRKFQATVFMTWAASLLFIFSAAATEAYGTLSKGEPLALAAMLGSVWMAQRASRSYRSWPSWTLAGGLALVAVGTRETAVVLAGIAGGWWLLSFWRHFGKPVLLPRRAMAIYLAVLAAGIAPLFAGRFLLRSSLAAGGYASRYRLTGHNLSQSGLYWCYNLVRNFPELVILLAAAAALAGRKHLRHGQLLWMMAVWMAMAAGILLPWPHNNPYYDLAFSAASSVFCGVMAGELLRMARSARRGWGGWVRRSTAGLVLGAVAALGLILAADNITFAESQIHVDEANWGMLDALVKLPPRSVVLVNIPRSHEYFYETGLYLQLLAGRPDLQVLPLDFQNPDAREQALPHYVVSLDEARQYWPLVRGPMTENVVAIWKKYWEESRSAAEARPAPRQIARTWQMADLGLEALWCGIDPQPAVVCPQPPFRPVLDLRQSYYAWKIYPYPLWQAPVRAASFDQGIWTIEQPEGAPLRLALGAPGDLPVAADWDGDGQMEPGVYRPSANRWFIDRSLSGKPDLVFSVPGMRSGDIPVAGVWEGPSAGPGYYRPDGFAWHLFRSATSTAEDFPVIHLGARSAIPLVGDWDGDGRATPGFYNPESGGILLKNALAEDAPPIGYGMPPGLPVVVNWTGSGVDTVNTIHNGKWERRFANCICEPSNPAPELSSGFSKGKIFAGRWRTPRRGDGVFTAEPRR
jgi:hypothetical protein